MVLHGEDLLRRMTCKNGNVIRIWTSGTPFVYYCELVASYGAVLNAEYVGLNRLLWWCRDRSKW